jgi:hypothetical protein
MPYKIEVTADSLSELAGKVLALAAQFQAVPTIVHHSGATPKADKPVKTAKAPAAQEPNVIVKVGSGGRESPSVDILNDPTVQRYAARRKFDVLEAQDPAPEEVKVEAAKAPTYDFNTDISPLVLRVAAEKGRPAIAELLSQFGVERASNVPTEQFGELLNALKDVLGE